MAQQFQNNIFIGIVGAPRYVTNEGSHLNLRVNSVRNETRWTRVKYLKRLELHQKTSAIYLLNNSIKMRFESLDLPDRFL